MLGNVSIAKVVKRFKRLTTKQKPINTKLRHRIIALIMRQEIIKKICVITLVITDYCTKLRINGENEKLGKTQAFRFY